jgi:dephospho-CoA kinase
MILGITGTLASGKGTVVDYLVARKGFGHYSVSGILKEILTERGQPLTRPYMSSLADELMKEHEGGILYLAHEQAKADGHEDYILESIHRPSEAEYVRSIGGHIFGVDADLRTRFERTLSRKEGAKDEVTFEEFVEHTKREEEGVDGTGPNIRAVLNGADAVFMNNGTLEELHQQIDEALTKLTG